MSDYIDWKQVPKKGRVRLVGSKGSQSYRYGKKTIIWSGSESSQAQSALNSRVKGTRQ